MVDMGVFFMYNEGYSMMCGYVVIVFGWYVVDLGFFSIDVLCLSVGEVFVFIECFCGVVKVLVDIEEGKLGCVCFVFVFVFVFGFDVEINMEKFGKVKVDIGFGGVFYVIVFGDWLGVDVWFFWINEIVDVVNVIINVVKS